MPSSPDPDVSSYVHVILRVLPFTVVLAAGCFLLGRFVGWAAFRSYRTRSRAQESEVEAMCEGEDGREDADLS